jgi:hypothetical protein
MNDNRVTQRQKVIKAGTITAAIPLASKTGKPIKARS